MLDVAPVSRDRGIAESRNRVTNDSVDVPDQSNDFFAELHRIIIRYEACDARDARMNVTIGDVVNETPNGGVRDR